MKWFLEAIKNKYAQFEGRSRRKEYWMFVLFYNLLTLGILLITGFVFEATGQETLLYAGLAIFAIVVIALIAPAWAISIRRLHDTGRSGKWMLLLFIPYLGSIILMILCMLDSEPGSNQYGENPKGIPNPSNL